MIKSSKDNILELITKKKYINKMVVSMYQLFFSPFSSTYTAKLVQSVNNFCRSCSW